MNVSLNSNQYELFFSNQLAPQAALNYADELFFQAFEVMCGARYRILSIIEDGWQNKYGLEKDILKLKTHFLAKTDVPNWGTQLLHRYDKESQILRHLLATVSQSDSRNLSDQELIEVIKDVRRKAAPLDAMSNMLYLYSALVGHDLLQNLSHYSSDVESINRNFIYFTQPIRESRFAKIQIKNLASKFHLSKEDATISQILRVGSYIKDDVTELLDLRTESLSALHQEIARRLDCSESDIDYLAIPEIEHFLLSKKPVNGLIGKRRKMTILFYADKLLKIHEGKTAHTFLKKGGFKKIEVDKEVEILKGQAASFGQAQGRVVVALTSRVAIAAMREGDVLVAPYTAVEYVPAMKKAAAIITETGGITSHAAIMSRELKIPCIIAVKDVTKLLRNDDFVEVDANNGMVRVIKRKE